MALREDNRSYNKCRSQEKQRSTKRTRPGISALRHRRWCSTTRDFSGEPTNDGPIRRKIVFPFLSRVRNVNNAIITQLRSKECRQKLIDVKVRIGAPECFVYFDLIDRSLLTKVSFSYLLSHKVWGETTKQRKHHIGTSIAPKQSFLCFKSFPLLKNVLLEDEPFSSCSNRSTQSRSGLLDLIVLLRASEDADLKIDNKPYEYQ